MSYMTSADRTRRLVKLYGLRSQVQNEIDQLEAAINTEAALIADAKKHGAKVRRRVAECGTDSGYYRHHRKDKTPPCDACRMAHNLAERRRVAKANGANVEDREDVAA